MSAILVCFLVLGSSLLADAIPSAPLPARCGRHEVSSCVRSCPPETTCRNRFVAVLCVETYEPCTETCVCEEGYYRNYLGDCITLEQCEQCDKPNEFFACDSACDNECNNIATQNRTNCPLVNIVCNKKCYCDDGYARDSKGNCVPLDECR